MTGTQIVVTGGDGFIGRNLRVRLKESGYTSVSIIEQDTSAQSRRAALASADFVFHLAGVNRPPDPAEFDTANRGFTALLCDELRATGRQVPVALASSTQALLNNPYGASKRAAEAVVEQYGTASGSAAYVFRLPNVFGKWCRPNYNSAVATFCHNLAHGIPISIHDPGAALSLVYIDDVVDAMIRLVREPGAPSGAVAVSPVYQTTVGDVATLIRQFADNRATLQPGRVGSGLERALYSTYVSYLDPSAFAYPLTRHADARGAFAEMLRTPDAGQFSFFTAHPGITRGGHYHHSKTEKFLVVSGRAQFRFRHIVSGEQHELIVTGDESRVVDTVPGWAHDITNIGTEQLVVMLWANETFDPVRPDTIAHSLQP